MWLIFPAAHAAIPPLDPSQIPGTEHPLGTLASPSPQPAGSPAFSGPTSPSGILTSDALPLTLSGMTTLEDVQVDGSGNSDSCITIAPGAEVTLRNVWITGCSANMGAAIRVEPGATLTIEESLFEEGHANSGGGLAAHEATVIIRDEATFRNNTSNGIGGHLFLVDSLLILEDSTLYGGDAGEGGGIYAQDSTVRLYDSSLYGNTAEGRGGAVFIAGGRLRLEQITAYDNSAKRGGGVIYGEDLNNVILLNPPEPAMGAIPSWSGNHTDANKGGHIFLNNQVGPVSIKDLVIEEPPGAPPQAEEGGAIFIRHSRPQDVTVRNSRFVHTAAGGRGGALLIEGSRDVLLQDNVFAQTRAGQQGGAIVLDEVGSALLSRNVYCDTEIDLRSSGSGSVLTLIGGGCLGGGCLAQHEQLIGAHSAGGAYSIISSRLTIEHLSARTRLPAWGPLLSLNADAQLTLRASWLEEVPVPLSGGQGQVSFDQVNVDTQAPQPVIAGGTTTHPTVLLGGADLAALPCGTEFRIHPTSPLVDLVEEVQGLVDLGAFEGPAPRTEWDHDGDGDGYPWRYDCDDLDPERSPGQPEVCGDGIDNDCDGRVDDRSGILILADPDGDGFAAQDAPSIVDCALASGGLPEDPDRPFDCVEGDPTIHPSAEEHVGDGIDQDCDGADAISFLKGPGCGCRGSSPPAGGLALLALALLRRRAGARTHRSASIGDVTT